MRYLLLTGVTILFLVFGVVHVASAIPVDYSVGGDFRIADRNLDDGVSALDTLRFDFEGSMTIESEGIVSDRSTFTIESFDLYVDALGLSWAGTGHICLFDHEIAGGQGYGYIQLEGTTSQGETWNQLNFLNRDALFLPTVFSLDLFTIGSDDGSDEEYYEGTSFLHAHDFQYSISERIAPVPEPATILFLCTGIAMLSGVKRKKLIN